jgi:hypothetical protein
LAAAPNSPVSMIAATRRIRTTGSPVPLIDSGIGVLERGFTLEWGDLQESCRASDTG